MGLFDSVQVHIPYPHLRERLPLFLDRGLNPEIYLPQTALRAISDAELRGYAGAFAAAARRVTIHGPFYDLSPGAVDAGFRALTLARMRIAMEVGAAFSPAALVFHPGYDPLRFGEHPEIWLRNSVRSWKALLPPPAGMEACWLLVENIFESGPGTLRALLAKLPSPPFGFCLDTGHFRIFSHETLADWFDALGPWLREVHLHDNRGDADAHLPPGAGSFAFDELFRRLSDLPHPVIGTLEMHREADIWQGLDYLRAQGVLPEGR